MDEHHVQDNLLKAYESSVLNPDYSASWLQTSSFSIMNYLSSAKFTSNLVSYIHSRQDWVMDCSECALDGSCEDLEKEQYFYPVSITYESLQVLQEKYENLFIIDVRSTMQWKEGHIPTSVTVPLTDVVPYLYPMNRWHEIVIVGDNYLETKIAGEALIQLNFHRVYRLIQSVEQYPGELDTIDGN
ncbi:MAG: rhodanese-like domain-containing protein [Caldisericia bacterium]|nr:rhodanese-like domain-containing protein [Caldisericia bacterium]